MQDYIEIAEKNGIILRDTGPCQFCGADTKRGIHECLEIFNLSFQGIEYARPEHPIFRFLVVDAHALQHPEIHGRWSNHFHLTRLHLIFKFDVKWTYNASPALSDHLSRYKVHKQDEHWLPPKALDRGSITSTDVLKNATFGDGNKELVIDWAKEVYSKWDTHHAVADTIAKGFLENK